VTRLGLLLMLLLASGVRAETLELRGATMGTTYHIKLVAPADAVDSERLHAEVEKVLAEIDLQMSTWRADSELSRFNRAKAGEWFAVSRAAAVVVAAAREISEKTDGAMDVTVGPLVRLWHFGAEAKRRNRSRGNGGDERRRSLSPPTDDEITAALELVGYEKLEVRLNPPALRKTVDGLEVDLSSIASGYAIDRLAALIAKRDAKSFMVELGGEVRAAGVREDGKPWRVAIERPAEDGRAMQTAVPLVDAAIATAGDYRKFFEYGGRRYSHVIDPAIGRPVDHELASVTVVAESCMAADGWDTPLLVLGPKRGLECAERNGVAAMFIERANGNAKVRTTSAWNQMFGSDGKTEKYKKTGEH
jgi:FAD:protein FMN transferase